MRVGIIDLGTNSVRFDVQEIRPGKKPRRLHREKLMIRLGQGVFLEGKLDSSAVRRTIQAFVSFKKTASILKVDKILAFGTSALREASDSADLLEKIRSKAGMDVRVIQGGEEAKLIAQGILANEKGLQGRFALVDIGGGSTEISVCQGSKILQSASFPLGTARLQQIFLKTSPPKREPIEALRRYVRSTILSKTIAEEWPKVPKVIGSSGTVRALAKTLKKTNGSKATPRKELSKLVKSMSAMTTTQLLGIPGMEAKRVDMILAGAILLEEAMNSLGAKEVRATNYSLREGILDEEVRVYRQHKGSHIAFHLQDLHAKAKLLGCNEPHLRQVAKLSEHLFDALRPLHRLKPEWKLYLTAAAILHDVGESITPTNHAAHSYYVVKNADFPSMEKWESEFVAQLCLRHARGKITKSALAFTGDPARRNAFTKLLAILRVADALDRGHKARVSIYRVRMTRDSVQLILSSTSSKDATDLELLRLDQKKSLFEEVFHKKLVARGI